MTAILLTAAQVEEFYLPMTPGQIELVAKNAFARLRPAMCLNWIALKECLEVGVCNVSPDDLQAVLDRMEVLRRLAAA